MKANSKLVTTTGQKFLQAQEDLARILAELDEAVDQLKKGWQDPAAESLIGNYREWRKFSGGSIQLINSLGETLVRIGRDYEKVDNNYGKKWE